MAYAFLLLLFSSKFIFGEGVMAIEEFKEVKDRVKMTAASETGELDMGVLDNRTKVLDTLERVGKVERVRVGELMKVKDLETMKEFKEVHRLKKMNELNEMKKLKEIKEIKELGVPREKRASFYKSGSELAYQVNHFLHLSLHLLVGF